MPRNPFSGPKGYKDPNLKNYAQGAYTGIANRAGATFNNGVADFTNSFKPMAGKAAVRNASEGYDFNPIKKAIAGFSSNPQLKETYNPYKFNFATLPSQYRTTAYQAGAKGIRREGAGQLQQLQQAIGTRRPGLLFKTAADAQRRQGEQLGDLNAQLGLKEMEQGLDAGRAQQMAQADEDYRGYGSRSDLEKANEANRQANLKNLADVGQSQIATKSGLLENERAYADQALQYLLNMTQNAAGGANQAAQIASANRGQTLGFLGGLAKI